MDKRKSETDKQTAGPTDKNYCKANKKIDRKANRPEKRKKARNREERRRRRNRNMFPVQLLLRTFLSGCGEGNVFSE